MQIVRKYGRKEGQNIYISLEADVDCETRIMIFKVFDLTKLSYVIRRQEVGHFLKNISFIAQMTCCVIDGENCGNE